MSVFKKIGKAVKKGTKQVSLKNLVKVGTPLLSMIPVVGGVASNIVGGMSDAHEAKKQAKAAAAQGNMEAAAVLEQKAEALANNAGQTFGTQTGQVMSAFAKGVVNETYAQTNQGFKEAVAVQGANLADLTAQSWLQKHWKHIAMAVGGLFGTVILWKTFMSSKPKRKGYRG
jgi:hypothetical protein